MVRFRLALCILLLPSAACMAKLKPVPNPPRDKSELTPAETPEAREEQYRQHRFVAAQKTTTVTTSDDFGVSVSQYQDLTLLQQDGNYYDLENYLPALHGAGIASGTTNPMDHYDDVNQHRPWLQAAGAAAVLGPVIALVIGAANQPDCGDSPSALDRDWEEQLDVYNECRQGAGLQTMPLLYGTFGGLGVAVGLGYVGLSRTNASYKPIRESNSQAEKERAAWAREWNRQLGEQLGVEETGDDSATP